MERGIAELIERAIAGRVFPGCCIGIIRNGERSLHAFGRATYDANAHSITGESLYDLASITKVVPTATLALQLIDAGALSLDDQLISFVPEYRTPYRDAVTIRHLLTYTLGNSVPLSRAGKTSAEIFATVCGEDSAVPGTMFNYSNTPAFLLGIVVERVRGTSLDQLAERLIFDPLHMKTATFAPHGAVPSAEGIQDVVHDESARVFSRAGMVVGHAGLFASTQDLLAFLAHLLANPDQRIARNQLEHLGVFAGLGWELNQAWMGRNRTATMFGKTGFTGTCIVGDFTRGMALVLLSNRTYPKSPEKRISIDVVRAAVCDIVFT